MDTLDIVGGIDLLVKIIGIIKCNRTNKKFELLFEGMMCGEIKMNSFERDFSIMNEERQDHWVDRFQEVVQSKSMKAIPSVGWLLSQEYKKPFYDEFYPYLKASQSLMLLADREFDGSVA